MIQSIQSLTGWDSSNPLSEHASQITGLHELRTNGGESLETHHVELAAPAHRPDPRHPKHGNRGNTDQRDTVTLDKTVLRQEDAEKQTRPSNPTPVQIAAKKQGERMVKVRDAAMKFLLNIATFNPAPKQQEHEEERPKVDTLV